MKATKPIHKYKMIIKENRQPKKNEVILFGQGWKYHYALCVAEMLINQKLEEVVMYS